MLDNKKAQIADTMTWVVATLVIVVILGILVFATYFVSNKNIIFIEDKQKDFIATKSITSFLRNGENVGLLKSGEEEQIESGMKNFLKILPKAKPIVVGQFGIIGYVRKGVLNWDFEIGENKDELDFGIKFYSNEIKLNFWAICFSAGCR